MTENEHPYLNTVPVSGPAYVELHDGSIVLADDWENTTEIQ